MADRVTASGQQLPIEHGGLRAVVVTTGAGLRSLSDGGRDLVVPYPADAVAPAFHGAVLAPWPNRLRDGHYDDGGRALQVPVSEPSRSTALHGLVCWSAWTVLAHEPTSVRLGLRLPASPGYPWTLDLDVAYAVSDAGLAVTTAARNVGAGAAPYGVGFHPWLSPGPGEVDDCTLSVAAGGHVRTDDRLLPTGVEPVAGDHDRRAPRSLRGVQLDDAFTDVERDDEGRSWARLAGPDGRTVAMWMDAAGRAWQVCTGDAVEDPAHRRAGVAVEPMTCVADAFRTGDDLVRLGPGQSHTITWGLRLE